MGGDNVCSKLATVKALSAAVPSMVGTSWADSGDRNSAAEGRRGICSLALPSRAGNPGLLEDSEE